MCFCNALECNSLRRTLTVKKPSPDFVANYRANVTSCCVITAGLPRKTVLTVAQGINWRNNNSESKTHQKVSHNSSELELTEILREMRNLFPSDTENVPSLKKRTSTKKCEESRSFVCLITSSRYARVSSSGHASRKRATSKLKLAVWMSPNWNIDFDL